MRRHQRYTFTPRVAADMLRRKPEAIKRRLVEAEEANVSDALTRCQELSLGDVSEEYMATMRPFSKAQHPALLLDPTIINAHNYEFYEAWHREGPEVVEESADRLRVQSSVINEASFARYLLAPHGTLFAFARPLLARVREELAELFSQRRRRAIRDALKEH